MKVAHFGLTGQAGLRGAGPGRVGLVLGRGLPEVVRTGGGGGGHVLGGAVLGFDAEVERGEMWRGRGAGLGGERAPPTGHTGNGNEKTFKKYIDLIIPQRNHKQSVIYLSFLSTLTIINSS